MQKVLLTWGNIREMAEQMAYRIIRREEAKDGFVLYGIPRGGLYTVALVAEILQKAGAKARVTGDPKEATVFTDDIIGTGETSRKWKSRFPSTPFYTLTSNKEYNGAWVVFPWESVQAETGPEENVTRMLQYVGEDPTRGGLLETPSRVVRSWGELYAGYQQDPASVLKTFDEGSHNEMVVLRDIEFYSTCEHHMLPFFGRAYIGYLPKKNGKIVGVSKLARLLDVFARRLQIQERIGQQIVQALMKYVDPEGCGCVLEAQHFCMTSRGVQKQNSVMVTNHMAGCFLERPEVKIEFLRMIGK